MRFIRSLNLQAQSLLIKKWNLLYIFCKNAQSIEIESPPKRREDVALKPTFVVDNLEVVRAAAKVNGGYLKPIKQAWRIRGYIVLDGTDPEGNVIQFKQVDPESQ